MNEILVYCAGFMAEAEIILRVMTLLSLDNISISRTQVPRIIFPMGSQVIPTLLAEAGLYISGLDFRKQLTFST